MTKQDDREEGKRKKEAGDEEKQRLTNELPIRAGCII